MGNLHYSDMSHWLHCNFLGGNYNCVVIVIQLQLVVEKVKNMLCYKTIWLANEKAVSLCAVTFHADNMKKSLLCAVHCCRACYLSIKGLSVGEFFI